MAKNLSKSARREKVLGQIAARRAERKRRRQAIREELVLRHAALRQERERRMSKFEAAMLGLPITFKVRGGYQIVFQFGPAKLSPDGIPFLPATSVTVVRADGRVIPILPHDKEVA
ncbi:MAG TPA: hypothetical protein PLK60_14820 [Myxococcota bacterium]|nr:hypothetical protein [Myxococcota bacterium]